MSYTIAIKKFTILQLSFSKLGQINGKFIFPYFCKAFVFSFHTVEKKQRIIFYVANHVIT